MPPGPGAPPAPPAPPCPGVPPAPPPLPAPAPGAPLAAGSAFAAGAGGAVATVAAPAEDSSAALAGLLDGVATDGVDVGGKRGAERRHKHQDAARPNYPSSLNNVG